MTLSRLHLHALVVVAAFLAALCTAHAQTEVEINLDALDSYRPPPMFGDAPPPETPLRSYAPLTGPQIVTPAPQIKTQAIPEQFAPVPANKTAPTPQRKPADTQRLAAPPVQQGSPPSPAIQRTKTTPPLPPRRPSSFHASEDFIETAQKNETKPEKEETAEKPKYPGIPETDYLSNELADPSVEEILAQIDKNESVEITEPEAKPKDTKPPEKKVKVRSPAAPKRITNISLGYLPGASELTSEVKQTLKGQLLTTLNEKPEARIEIHAFASSTDEGQTSARRISLARALELRRFLISQDIDPGRIDIRPLGNETATKPLDRIDIFVKN